MGYDTVLVLSEMYAVQRVHKQTGMQLVEATMATSAYAVVLEKDIDNNQYQTHLGPYFELLSAIEAQLLLVHGSALVDIETRE